MAFDDISPEDLQAFIDTYGKNSPKTANEMLNASRQQALDQTLSKANTQDLVKSLTKPATASTAEESASVFSKAMPAGVEESKALVPYAEKGLVPAGEKGLATIAPQAAESTGSGFLAKLLGKSAKFAGPVADATAALSSPNDNGDMIQGLPGTSMERPKAGDMEGKQVPGRPGMIFAGQDIIPDPNRKPTGDTSPEGLAVSLKQRSGDDLPKQSTSPVQEQPDDASIVNKLDRSIGTPPGLDPSKTINFGTGSMDTVENLKEAQNRESAAVLANQLGSAGANFGHALSRATNPVDNSGFENNIKQAGKITQNFKDQAAEEKNDPNSAVSKGYREAMKRFGITVKGDASASSLEKVAPWLEKVYIADESRKQRAFDADQQRLLRETIAEGNNASRRDISDSRKSDKEEKVNDKLINDMKNDLDPNKARGGNLAKSQSMINSAERVNALFEQFPDGNIPLIQTHELASAVAGLINGGSAQSQTQINSLTPKTLKGDSVKIADWITGNPHGAEQQNFMKMLKDTTQREKDTALHQVKSAQIQRLSAYEKLKNNDPDNYNRVLSSYGIDPSEIDEKGRFKAQKVLTTESNSKSPSTQQDPKITQYAQQYGIDYPHAEQILRSRGYGK